MFFSLRIHHLSLLYPRSPVISQDDEVIIRRRRDFAKISQGAVREIALDDVTSRPSIFDRALFLCRFLNAAAGGVDQSANCVPQMFPVVQASSTVPYFLAVF